MTQKTKLTKRTVDAQKARQGEYIVWDTDVRGYGLRVHPTGRKTYFLKYRTRSNGKQIKMNIGVHGDVTADSARKIAENWRDEISSGGDPRARIRTTADGNEDSFKSVAENFIKRYVERRKLRSRRDIERQLSTYVYPRWGDRAFTSITRRDVAELLDKIEDGSGPVQADRVLATVRKLCNWYQTRDDDFVSPVVKGMARTRPAEHKRDRVLSDDEIRALWPQLEGTFGALVKVLLLTGQRLGKVSTMRRQDIEGDVWTIPTEPREKNNPGSLKLPQAALDAIRQAVDATEVANTGRGKVWAGEAPCPYVFPGRTFQKGTNHKGPMTGFSKLKRDVDKKTDIPEWRLHDLRRTARSLMSRAGVSSEHAERVLGHVISGVEGVYDRHSYDKEKAAALRKLADQIDMILNPPKGNVVSLAAGE